jgi:CheY-like chemotaxis protein
VNKRGDGPKNGSDGSGEGGEAAGFAGKRALLVEDNLINMEIADMILTQPGFTVDKAENGQIAVDMIRGAEAGTYDLVPMDIQMPVMDGYEATRTIRAMEDGRKAAIPIVAMTANAFKEDEAAAMEAGMQAHIAKPIDVDSMMKTLGRVLRESARTDETRRQAGQETIR